MSQAFCIFAENLLKMKFVDIKNDIAFRKIFGNENKRVILISFLNAVLHLEGDNRIKNITIENPFQLPILQNFKASIIDVKARDFKGNTFIVEMQVADVIGMDKRLLYYTGKEYSQQLVSGEKYTELNPVIFIGIFDFDFTKGTDYYSHHAICNVKTQERVIKDMDFYFIELPKFNKDVKILDNIMDKWIYFIKEAPNLDVIPDNVTDEGLKEAYTDANRHLWTIAELNAYIYAGMRDQDGRGSILKAEQKAEARGEARGEANAKKEAVLGLDKIGLEKEKIAEALNISIERVIDILEKYKSA